MKLEFHHINFVSKNVDGMNDFYKRILEMDSIPTEHFPRTEETI
jgi:glyoxylase I family protein